jgi:hypothetical protein
MLDGIFECLGDGRDPMITWSAEYLRERLAKVTGRGNERVAELEAAKATAVR